MAEDCIHNWAIAPADGPKSLGECSKCHEVRGFYNYIEGYGEGSLGDASGGLRGKKKHHRTGKRWGDTKINSGRPRHEPPMPGSVSGPLI